MKKPRHITLAAALARARGAAKRSIVQSSDLKRSDRERLLSAGYLSEIMKGWYLLSQAATDVGESTAWYGGFWDFLAVYLDHRFSTGYCLSAQSSLDIHLGVPTIPSQVVVIASKGGTTVLNLPHDTSLAVYQDADRLPETAMELCGLRIMPYATALVRVPASFFRAHPPTAEIALRALASVGELTSCLAESGNASSAARLAGAFLAIGEEGKARQIVDDMAVTGMKVAPENPFEADTSFHVKALSKSAPPHVLRIQSLWARMREVTHRSLAKPDGVPQELKRYGRLVDDIYGQDAYNSLSIEGYSVTPELIERIRSGKWYPEQNSGDQQQRNAMAAKGYRAAFESVGDSISRVIGKKEEAGAVARHDLRTWHSQLFLPTVEAGLLESHHLVGYRQQPIYIRASRHVPPRWEVVDGTMECFFDLLESEEDASTRAILGHFIFVYIHPYVDGNGRLGRFLMNVVLAGGGYPWTIVRTARRAEYMSALEFASVREDIAPFVTFIQEEMHASWVSWVDSRNADANDRGEDRDRVRL